eukprot:gene3192-3664_t
MSQEVPVKSTDGKLLNLPLARVKMIMRSSPDLASVSQEAYFLIAKSAELFAQYFAQQGFNSDSGGKELNYTGLASAVEKDDSLDFLGVASKKRKCKDVYTAAWWEYPPYVYQTDTNQVSGIFPKLMRLMAQGCCQSKVNVSFAYVLATRNEAVEQVVNGSADFVLPLILKPGKTKFLSFPFVPFVDSPGVAFYTASSMSAGDSLVKVLLVSFPILVYSLIMSLIVGTLFWIFEYQDDREFGLSILNKLQDGVWWAFVSMTTVGYGDVYPKTRCGQALAVVWISFGIAIVALFVANVSSFLTTSCLSHTTEIRGSKIAVISGSQEHSLAVRGSAIPVEHSNVYDLANSMRKGDAVGAMLDSYVAGYYQNIFREFRLNDLREDLFSYGVVLSPSILSQERCFRDFITSNQHIIFQYISENIKPLKKTREKSTAEEMSSQFLHFGQLKTYVPVVIILGISCLLFGLCYFIQMAKELKKRNRKHKSFRKKICKDTEETLKGLEQTHLRELTNCLQSIYKESVILQDSCNVVLNTAEQQAFSVFNERFSERETTV